MRYIHHCLPCIDSNSASTKGMLTATIQSSLYFTQHADHLRKFQGREGKCRSKIKCISSKEKERSCNKDIDITIYIYIYIFAFEVQVCYSFPGKCPTLSHFWKQGEWSRTFHIALWIPLDTVSNLRSWFLLISQCPLYSSIQRTRIFRTRK